MNYTINELKFEIFQDVYVVYEIFQNFFGERYTDLQNIPTDESIAEALSTLDITGNDGVYSLTRAQFNNVKHNYSTLRPFILVWWPSVTVTNENDRSVEIQDLYAKVALTMEGTIPWENTGFQLIRTSFPEIQYRDGYLHSHVPSFRDIPAYSNPCLGTGPIRNTIGELKRGYEEALWMLFCQELSLYVTVESLTGGPYFRMETIGGNKLLSGFMRYENASSLESIQTRHHISANKIPLFKSILRHFIAYYIEHGHLSFSFADGKFVPGMPYFDYMIDVSNAFISFFNKHGRQEYVDELFNQDIMVKSLVSNNKFYKNDTPLRHDYPHEGEYMLTFKGQEKNLRILREDNAHTEVTLLLHQDIAMFILCNILKVINYRFKNEHSRNTESGAFQEGAPKTYQRVCYL